MNPGDQVAINQLMDVLERVHVEPSGFVLGLRVALERPEWAAPMLASMYRLGIAKNEDGDAIITLTELVPVS